MRESRMARNRSITSRYKSLAKRASGPAEAHVDRSVPKFAIVGKFLKDGVVTSRLDYGKDPLQHGIGDHRSMPDIQIGRVQHVP